MYVIAIHGGAGLSTPEDLGEEREAIARIALEKSLWREKSSPKWGHT